jgi:hypothetical protein
MVIRRSSSAVDGDIVSRTEYRAPAVAAVSIRPGAARDQLAGFVE